MVRLAGSERQDVALRAARLYLAAAGRGPAEDAAAERLSKLKTAGVDKIAFAWSGETAAGQKHYYRVQGPTFLIEFDDVQNNGNHIHSVWRDFNGDFGRNVLAEHLAAFPH
jgi:hypothetical protein